MLHRETTTPFIWVVRGPRCEFLACQRGAGMASLGVEPAKALRLCVA